MRSKSNKKVIRVSRFEVSVSTAIRLITKQNLFSHSKRYKTKSVLICIDHSSSDNLSGLEVINNNFINESIEKRIQKQSGA